MRKETQQSAFDKQLSKYAMSSPQAVLQARELELTCSHCFTRQTFKSQSRKIIAHPKVRADDQEFWEAVRALPRLEAIDEKKVSLSSIRPCSGRECRPLQESCPHSS